MEQRALKRSRWTPDRKAALVLAWLRGWNAGEMAHNYGLSQAQLLAWRDRFLAGGQAALTVRRAVWEREHVRRIRTLQRKGRRLTLESEMLRKARGQRPTAE